MTKNTFDRTICAPATIPGTGAISIIRISGDGALDIADRVVTVKGDRIDETEGYRLRYGKIVDGDGTLIDDVVLSVFRAPHSYTGENSVEISCHSSKYIVNAILKLLINAGAEMAAPGEFTQRAFLNGKMDLAQAEAVADLIASSNAASHNVAMNQLKGGFSKELKSLRDKLLKMTSLLELELDFSEEDVEFAGRADLISLVDNTLVHINHLAGSFSRGNAIKNGIPVVIAGSTNAGKSTLLNAIVGEDRAIVSDIAGTTRDTIEEVMTIDGAQFRFIDTAGIRETDERVERIGIERTFAKINEAAVVLGMVDASLDSDSVVSDIRQILDSTSQGESKKTIILLNKCDLFKESDLYQKSDTPKRAFSISQVQNQVCLSHAKDRKVAYEIRTDNIKESSSTSIADIDTGCAADDVPASTNNNPEIATDCVADDDNGTRSANDRFRKDDSSAINIINSGIQPTNNNETITIFESVKIKDLLDTLKDNSSIIDIIPISAKCGTGLQQLKDTLSKTAASIVGNTDETLVTNVRHYNALVNASHCLSRVHSGLENSTIPVDLIAQDLREALYHLGSIIGEISTDEVLGNIFKNFCVGK